MRFYQRLDTQLALFVITIFAVMITITGLLERTKSQIWITTPTAEVTEHLAAIDSQFQQLASAETRTQLESRAVPMLKSFANQHSDLALVYLVTTTEFVKVADSTDQHTFIELVRNDTNQNRYSVVTSSAFDRNEIFMIFNQVPALKISTAYGESILLMAVPDASKTEAQNMQQVLRSKVTNHVNVFGWYYLMAMVIVITFVRLRLAPLRQLEDAANQLTHNKIPHSIEIKTTNDEVGQLVNAFNTAITRLSENEAMRSRLISDISHELRTPLTNLSGRIEAYEDGIINDHQGLIKFTSQQIQGLVHIVEDMSLLTSLDTGELSLNPDSTPLLPLLEEILDTAKFANPFEWSVTGTSVTLPLDVLRFKQIINNLVSNAEKAKPQGLRITVTISRSSNRAVINFEDNGPGVTAEHLPYLFERLYRIDDSRNKATGGTGLGLSIVKNLVEAHGGSVECYSVTTGGLGFKLSFVC